jgi:hypothetical protein
MTSVAAESPTQPPCHTPYGQFSLIFQSAGPLYQPPVPHYRFMPSVWCRFSRSQIADHVEDAPEQVSRHGGLYAAVESSATGAAPFWRCGQR